MNRAKKGLAFVLTIIFFFLFAYGSFAQCDRPEYPVKKVNKEKYYDIPKKSIEIHAKVTRPVNEHRIRKAMPLINRKRKGV